MKEDYCSFELSKLLKEKGFEQHKTKLAYDKNGKLRWSDNLDPFEFSTPTHQMAMKWLREVHNIHIAVDRGIEHYFAVLTKLKPYQDLTMKNDVFDTYEEAVEAAIKYSLENLI